MMKIRSQKSKHYRPLSRRLSLRIILVMLATMALMGWCMTSLNKAALEDVSNAHYHVLLDVTDKLIEKDLDNMKPLLVGDSTGEAAEKTLRWLRHWLMEQDNNFNRRGMFMIHKDVKYRKDIWVYSVICSRDGRYLSHPDSASMLSKNLLDQISQNSDTMSIRLASDIRKGVGGEAVTVIHGQRVKVFYDPLAHTDWMMALIVPTKVEKILVLTWDTFQGIFILLALLVIYPLCHFTIRRTMRPLHALTESADQVAKGRFDTPLPEIRHRDEVALLRDSFGHMQQSLAKYIEQLQTTTSEKASIEQELKIASGIQMALLPKPLPERDDISIHALVNPARIVGGDLYDYFISDGRLVFCIGDVSGKGVPAALMMAVIRAMFRSEARRSSSAAEIVKTLNHNLSHEYTADYFVTMFVGILNLKTGRLDYCNAGHEHPLVSGQPLPAKCNVPVGVLPQWDYEGQEATLQQGDTLFLFTDGLSEALSAEGKLFGRQPIRRLVASHAHCAPLELAELVEREVRQFVGNTEQSDDLTLLIIKYNAAPSLSPLSSLLSPLSSSLTIPPNISHLDQMEPFIAKASRQAGHTNKEAKEMRLAVEEALSNIINYSQATFINLNASTEDGCLKVTITDDGIPFDATAPSDTDLSIPADQRPPGGLGIILLQRLTDRRDYQRTDNRNVLTLVKKTKKET